MKAKEIAENIYNDEYYKGKAEQAIKDYALHIAEQAVDQVCEEIHVGSFKEVVIDEILSRIKTLTETE